MFFNVLKNATNLNCGKALKFQLPPLSRNRNGGTRLIAVPNGNKVENWVIRIQAPTTAMVRLRRRFNDYNDLGLKGLTTPNDSIRYSLNRLPRAKLKYPERGGIFPTRKLFLRLAANASYGKKLSISVPPTLVR